MEQTQKKVTLNVEGMTCSNCAIGISRHLQHQGLKDVNTNFATGEVNFTIEEETQIPVIVKEINGLGYKVIDNPPAELRDGHLSPVEKRFYLSLVFTIPLFLHMFLSWSVLHDPLVQLALCIPVFIIGLIHFGKSAIGSIKARVPNMDVLILIGSTSAFVYSVFGTFVYSDSAHQHNFLFFETTATIISLVLLGNVLEHRSVRQTTSAIKDLSKMQPAFAKKVVNENNQEKIIEVPYNEINVNDLLSVNSGDKIPIDGEIVSGTAAIDESMITGESVPVEKAENDSVIGGTIAVNGNITIRATAVGKDTLLSKIIDLVKNAQNDKPSIQKLGDKVSSVFVPIVLAISLLTFCSWYFFLFDWIKPSYATFSKAPFSMMAAIAVLVISCPCAMGLATPTAVMAGIGRAAKQGILIKGGSTLEELAKIKNIIFDKTGTLTTGNFKISKINIVGSESNEREVQNLLYSMEQKSSHPIAKSIVNELEKIATPVSISKLEEKKGHGLLATTANGDEFILGSYRLAKEVTSDANHSLYLLKNKSLIATIDIEDELKNEVSETVSNLKDQDLNVILISGDKDEKTRTLAKLIGIENVHSEKLPEEKQDLLNEYSLNGKTAMVGDGINDAPSLAKADVGISIGNATQVAIHASQVILPAGEDIKKVFDAYLISKHTLITIKQNLFWAFFYNVVAIPIAAAGLLNPMVGALAMAFSDVIVIGNSIRLKTKKLSSK